MNNNSAILQWNLYGFCSQLEQLQILMDTHNPIIICIQEINFNDSAPKSRVIEAIEDN